MIATDPPVSLQLVKSRGKTSGGNRKSHWRILISAPRSVEIEIRKPGREAAAETA